MNFCQKDTGLNGLKIYFCGSFQIFYVHNGNEFVNCIYEQMSVCASGWICDWEFVLLAHLPGMKSGEFCF